MAPRTAPAKGVMDHISSTTLTTPHAFCRANRSRSVNICSLKAGSRSSSTARTASCVTPEEDTTRPNRKITTSSSGIRDRNP
jgi:hypothetical protein